MLGNVLATPNPPIVADTVLDVPANVPVKTVTYLPLELSATALNVPFEDPPPERENWTDSPPEVRRLPLASLAMSVINVVSPDAIKARPTEIVL